MAVYDDEKEKQASKTSDDDLRQMTGIGTDEEGAMEREAYNGAATDLAQREKEADSRPLDRASRQESGALADRHQIPFRKEGGGKRRLNLRQALRNRKVFGGGLVGFIIAAIIGMFSITSGPLKAIHFASLLHQFHFLSDESFMNSRVGNLIRFAYTVDDPNKRNLGFIGNAVADHYEGKLRASGMEPELRNRRIVAINIDVNSAEGRQAITNFRQQGLDVPDPDGSGRVRIDLSSSSARTRRHAITGMVKSINLDGVSTYVAARALKVRGAVDLHPFKNIIRATDEKLADYRTRVRDQTAETRRRGATETFTRNAEAPPEDDEETDGSQQERDQSAAAEADEVRADLNNESSGDIDARAAEMKSKLARGVGVTGFISLACGLKALGDSIEEIRASNIVAPLTRIGAEVLARGSQLQAPLDNKDLNSDEVGVYVSTLYDEETQTDAVGAKSIQHELGQPQTGPDIPEGSKPGHTEKPPFFRLLDQTLGQIPFNGPICAGVGSAFGGLVLDGIGWALDSTGPVGFFSKMATDFAIGFAIGLFVDDVVRWVAGQQVVTDPLGALLGGYANYGALLSANQVAIAHGGIERTPQETAMVDAERGQQLDTELRQKSFFARYFDLHEPRSLASRTLFQNEEFSSPSSTIASVVSAPWKLLGSLSGSLRNTFVPSAGAADAPYDYGFPEYGFTVEEMDDPMFEDPYANAEIVEPNLATKTVDGVKIPGLNEKYGEPCFGTTVDPTTFKLVQVNQLTRYERIPDRCKDRDNEELTRYRFYLADMTAAKSLACYESLDEAACNELGFGSNVIGAPSSSALPSGDIRDVARQVLDSPNITWRNPTARSQIAAVADGGGDVDQTLIRVIAALAEKHRFAISSLKRCTPGIGAGENSRHCLGKAVDISGAGGIDGKVFDYGSTDSVVQAFLDEAMALLPEGCEVGVPNATFVGQSRPKAKTGCNVFVDTGTAPHIHLGVAR